MSFIIEVGYNDYFFLIFIRFLEVLNGVYLVFGGEGEKTFMKKWNDCGKFLF